MKFEVIGIGVDLFMESKWRGIVVFVGDIDVDWKSVGSLKYYVYIVFIRGVSCCRCFGIVGMCK